MIACWCSGFPKHDSDCLVGRHASLRYTTGFFFGTAICAVMFVLWILVATKFAPPAHADDGSVSADDNCECEEKG